MRRFRSKPHIRLVDGVWRCGVVLEVGMGRTPVEAYRDWDKATGCGKRWRVAVRT